MADILDIYLCDFCENISRQNDEILIFSERKFIEEVGGGVRREIGAQSTRCGQTSAIVSPTSATP